MKRTALFALTLAALSLLLVALSFAPTRGASPVAWMPFDGAFSVVPGATYGPVPLYLPSPTATPIAPSPTPARTPRSATSAPKPTPRPTGEIGTAVGAVKGVGTFYAAPTGTAAAAKRLRDAIGPTWRGRRVRVCYGSRCIVVLLDDYESSTIPGRLIDLSEGSFEQLAGPGWYQRGILPLTVEW